MCERDSVLTCACSSVLSDPVLSQSSATGLRGSKSGRVSPASHAVTCSMLGDRSGGEPSGCRTQSLEEPVVLLCYHLPTGGCLPALLDTCCEARVLVMVILPGRDKGGGLTRSPECSAKSQSIFKADHHRQF